MNWPQVGTVHVHPAGPDGHVPSKRCGCGPTVERWTVAGRQHVRVIHNQLEPLEVARPRAEDVLPGPRATHGVQP